jgi:GNAT superfamily N-acetyltransferase
LEGLSVSARVGAPEDLPALLDLYRGLEVEMTELHPMWPLADGLPEPLEAAFIDSMSDEGMIVVVGDLDGYPFGFLVAVIEDMLPQGRGKHVGSIHLVYVDPDAREVGLGETMREFALDMLRERGITRFDAHVLPGHRLAKNFFEAGGFSARSIVMHHDDDRT